MPETDPTTLSKLFLSFIKLMSRASALWDQGVNVAMDVYEGCWITCHMESQTAMRVLDPHVVHDNCARSVSHNGLSLIRGVCEAGESIIKASERCGRVALKRDGVYCDMDWEDAILILLADSSEHHGNQTSLSQHLHMPL